MNVVGDLQDLQPVLGAPDGIQPADVPEEALLEISLTALVMMARRLDSAKLTRLQDQVRRFERHPGREALGMYARAVRARFAGLRRQQK